jgi:hypothetical protein
MVAAQDWLSFDLTVGNIADTRVSQISECGLLEQQESLDFRDERAK